MKNYNLLFKRILLTGGSGFLGNYIKQEILKVGQVITLSSTKADIKIDLSAKVPNLKSVDLVVHCAGKAHSVPRTETEKQEFFNVNLIGTANLLMGLERAENLPKSFVFISTVAVYGCDFGTLITEQNPLNAKDPYGKSKIQAEQLVQDWCKIHNVVCSILRLPLLVGINPPGNLASMIKGIKRGYYFNIAGGKAKKSMVLAIDVAKLIPKVAQIGGVYNLTDGLDPSFKELSEIISNQLRKSKPINLPYWIANAMAKIGDLFADGVPLNTNKLMKITSTLTFDSSKAANELSWKPNSVLKGITVN